MHKWQSTMVMVLGGIAPVAVAIVSLQQFRIIGLDTALLLGLLYLLFISTHLWCRIFTKMPPSEQHQQVDSLPCYEEAIKSDPPPYSALYPGNSTPYDVTSSSMAPPTSAVSQKSTFDAAGSYQFGRNDLNIVTVNPVPDPTPDDLPILGRLYNYKDSRRNSRAILVVPAHMSAGVRPLMSAESSESPTRSFETPTVTSGKEERRLEKNKVYSEMRESFAHPVDLV